MVEYEAVSSIFDNHGLDWLVVVGQDLTCEKNEIWSFGSCHPCPDGQVPLDERTCSPCPGGQEPDADKLRCECPLGTFAQISTAEERLEEDGDEQGGIYCKKCLELAEKITGLYTAQADVAWESQAVCPGGPPTASSICPLDGLWISVPGEQGLATSDIELLACPSCVKAPCSPDLRP